MAAEERAGMYAMALFRVAERTGLVDDWASYPWCGSYQWPDIDEALRSRHSNEVLWASALAHPIVDADDDDGGG